MRVLSSFTTSQDPQSHKATIKAKPRLNRQPTIISSDEEGKEDQQNGQKEDDPNELEFTKKANMFHSALNAFDMQPQQLDPVAGSSEIPNDTRINESEFFGKNAKTKMISMKWKSARKSNNLNEVMQSV